MKKLCTQVYALLDEHDNCDKFTAPEYKQSRGKNLSVQVYLAHSFLPKRAVLQTSYSQKNCPGPTLLGFPG